MEERYPADACSEEEFAALAERELDALPEWIKAAIAGHNVAISIEDQHPSEPRTLGVFAPIIGCPRDRGNSSPWPTTRRAAGSRVASGWRSDAYTAWSVWLLAAGMVLLT